MTLKNVEVSLEQFWEFCNYVLETVCRDRIRHKVVHREFQSRIRIFSQGFVGRRDDLNRFR